MSVEIGLFLLILGLFPLKNLKKQQKSNLAHPECSTNFSDLSFWILHLYTSKGLNPKFRARECILKVLSINDTSFLSIYLPRILPSELGIHQPDVLEIVKSSEQSFSPCDSWYRIFWEQGSASQPR